MSNRSHPVAGAPQAAPIETVGTRSKRTQGAAPPHPSTNASQCQPGGRSHPVPGLAAASPLTSAVGTRPKNYPVPKQANSGAKADLNGFVGSTYRPELADKILAEATVGGSKIPEGE